MTKKRAPYKLTFGDSPVEYFSVEILLRGELNMHLSSYTNDFMTNTMRLKIAVKNQLCSKGHCSED